MLKKLLLVLALSVSTSAFAQGTFNFLTFNSTNAALGKVTQAGGVANADTTFRVQVYGAAVNDVSQFVPIGTPATINGTSGYVNAGGVTVPTVDGKNTFFYQLRAWNVVGGSSYENALTVNGAQAGTSAVAQIVLGGGAFPPATPQNVNLTPNFSTVIVSTIPEPSTIAFAVIGIGALALRRRK
jgi:hypothetical protein